MKRLLLASAALGLLAGAAYAADPVIMEPIPAMAPVMSTYDWSGFYIGPQIGYGWGSADIDDGFGFDPSPEIDGFYAGGIFGAQWQWNWLVIGAEAEANWSDIDGDELFPVGVDNVAEAGIEWFGSVNGKLGVAFDRVMVYGTGGVAFASIETGQDFGGIGLAFSEEEGYTGWTAGGGLDVAVTESIIVGAQYRYYDFGSEDFDSPAPFTDRSQDVDLHTVSTHVTYKF